MPPRAILFDLDDTLISAYGRPEQAWPQVTALFAEQLSPLAPDLVAHAIASFGVQFWADAGLHKQWRTDLVAARREIVTGAFMRLAAEGTPVPRPDIANELADRFSRFRDEQMHLFDGALRVVTGLKQNGFLLGLITNGGSAVQRRKIDRFGLASCFDHIQIEEEVGFGKPEPRAYRHALSCLSVAAQDAWIVGDNYHWEVEAPQALGLTGILFDPHGLGLPASRVRPGQVISRLDDLLALAARNTKRAI